MDEDDDGADFLGGARRAISAGPWANTGNSPVFVPQWSYQEDNPGCDLQSISDYIRHAMPPGIGKKMSALTPHQSLRRFAKASFDNFMFSINTLHVADQSERMNRKMAESIKRSRAQLAAEAEKIRHEREAFDKFKADHEADIAKVNEMAAEIDALKAKLVEKEGKVGEMEVSLQRCGQELNDALSERDGVTVARDQAIADRDQAFLERDQAIAEKKKLQSSLPAVTFTSLGCPGISVPFGTVVKYARQMGQHEVATLTAKHLDPLLVEISAKLDPEIISKAQAAGAALKNLNTCPFLEKLTADLDMPVDESLALKPDKH